MPDNIPNFTPERKAQLRRSVLDEIEKTKQPEPKAQPKAAEQKPPLRQPPLRRTVSQSVLKTPAPSSPLPKIIAKPIEDKPKEIVRPVVTSAPPVVKVQPKPQAAKPRVVVKRSRPTPIWPPVKKAQKPILPKVAPIAHKTPVLSQIMPIQKPSVKPKKPVFRSFRLTMGKHSSRPSLGQPGLSRGIRKSHSHHLARWTAVLILAVIGAGIVTGFGMYRFSWHDTITQTLARILFLPAGNINGDVIGLADYLRDVDLLTKSMNQGREGVMSKINLGQSTQEKIFIRLAVMKLIDKKLAAYGQSVSPQEIDKAVTDLIAQTGTREKLEQDIKSFYGLNLSEFQDLVIAPMLAREKLQTAIANDETLDINKKARQKAEEVLAIARQGQTIFPQLAATFTQDESGINTGGEMNWVSRGQLPAEMEKVLFSLSDGQVASELVKSRAGYHIFQVEKKLTDATTGQESVKARQILIKVDLDQYLKELLDQAQIAKYVK